MDYAPNSMHYSQDHSQNHCQNNVVALKIMHCTYDYSIREIYCNH